MVKIYDSFNADGYQEVVSTGPMVTLKYDNHGGKYKAPTHVSWDRCA